MTEGEAVALIHKVIKRMIMTQIKMVIMMEEEDNL